MSLILQNGNFEETGYVQLDGYSDIFKKVLEQLFLFYFVLNKNALASLALCFIEFY